MRHDPHFAHQIEEYKKYRYAEARALAWQMRTGKSRAIVESAEALENMFEINGVLIIAPNGVHVDWVKEHIPSWYSKHVDAFAWQFSNKANERDFNLWACFLGVRKWLHWFCVNMEVAMRDEVRQAIKAFKRAVGPAMLVVDESHHFARPGAIRTGVMRSFARDFEYRRILSGTISENSPFQTFSQYELLGKAALGHTTFSGTAKNSVSKTPCPTCGPRCRGFKREFGEWGIERRGGHAIAVLENYKNLDTLKQRMAPYTSVVLRSDCNDLPPLHFDKREVVMTPDQQMWWDTVRDQEIEMMDQLGLDKVYDGGAAYTKLQQIEGGFMLQDVDNGLKKTKKLIDICGKENPKMLILFDEISQYSGQVIIWFAYTHEIGAAFKFLSGLGIKCGVFDGRALKTRDRDLAAFMAGELDVLLAQPQAGGEGRNMSAAGKIIWYSQTMMDATIRSQANERATLAGGKSIQIVDLIAPISSYLLKGMEQKRDIADDVSRYGLKSILLGAA